MLLLPFDLHNWILLSMALVPLSVLGCHLGTQWSHPGTTFTVPNLSPPLPLPTLPLLLPLTSSLLQDLQKVVELGRQRLFGLVSKGQLRMVS